MNHPDYLFDKLGAKLESLAKESETRNVPIGIVFCPTLKKFLVKMSLSSTALSFRKSFTKSVEDIMTFN